MESYFYSAKLKGKTIHLLFWYLSVLAKAFPVPLILLIYKKNLDRKNKLLIRKRIHNTSYSALELKNGKTDICYRSSSCVPAPVLHLSVVTGSVTEVGMAFLTLLFKSPIQVRSIHYRTKYTTVTWHNIQNHKSSSNLCTFFLWQE